MKYHTGSSLIFHLGAYLIPLGLFQKREISLGFVFVIMSNKIPVIYLMFKCLKISFCHSYCNMFYSLSEDRVGDICNACVLLVKRWKKLPHGSKKNWNHVRDCFLVFTGIIPFIPDILRIILFPSQGGGCEGRTWIQADQTQESQKY